MFLIPNKDKLTKIFANVKGFSHQQIADLLYNEITGKFSGFIWLEEVYDEYFIAGVHNEDSLLYYKFDYTANAEDKSVKVNEPEEVIREINWITNQEMKDKNIVEANMCVIDVLIESGKFNEDDREFLGGLPVAQLDKFASLIPNEDKPEVNEDAPEVEPEVNEDTPEVNEDKGVTFTEDELKAHDAAVIAANQAKVAHDNLVNEIFALNEDISVETLQKMEDKELASLKENLQKNNGDYSGISVFSKDSDEEPEANENKQGLGVFLK